MDSQDKTPKIWQRALALACTITAVGSWLYVAAGPGFYAAPCGYTIAWLAFLASAAYAVPMLDVTIDTVAGACNRVRRVVWGVGSALADMRRRPCNPARRVRVVRSEAKEVR